MTPTADYEDCSHEHGNQDDEECQDFQELGYRLRPTLQSVWALGSLGESAICENGARQFLGSKDSLGPLH